MAAVDYSLLECITLDPDVRFGKTCIRSQSAGASQQHILTHYPQLEPEDFLAV